MTIHQVLKQYWGYESFRPLQEEIVTSVLQKRDTLALLPTGGGKSICFQVPAMAMDGICIVVSPLIALMKDQVENLQKRGIQALAIISGMGKREIDIALDNCIYGPVKFLYVSPERMMTDLVRERIKYMKVNLLAIDEAHCISQWGYDFRPPYLHIKELREILPDVPVVALTASATSKVQADIIQHLNLHNVALFKKSFERSNLSYSVFTIENKLNKLVQICQNVKGTGIVYVRTRRDTFETARYLQQHGIASAFYHAGLDAEARSVTQQNWMDNKVRVIVATNAFGMGIDKPDVRFVIHYELPDSPEAYYQEAGRAGRDEQKSYAVLLYDPVDRISFAKRFQQSFPPLDVIKKTYHFLCNYLQIPFESGEGAVYDFDIGDFCSQFKLDVMMVIGAIKTLEQNEYLLLSENALLPSRVQFLVNGEDLYKFQVENFRYDLFIKTVLRTYGGAFDRFSVIQEKEIAQKLSITPFQVSGIFSELDELGVLTYIKKTNQPLLTFLRPRYDSAHLHFDTKHYQMRKEMYQLKMEAMLNYVEKQECRSKQLLTYFDELAVSDCGVCDVCLDKRKSFMRDEISEEIRSALQGKRLSLQELLSLLKIGSETEKIEMIRLLVNVNVLHKDEGFFQLSNLNHSD